MEVRKQEILYDGILAVLRELVSKNNSDNKPISWALRFMDNNTICCPSLANGLKLSKVVNNNEIYLEFFFNNKKVYAFGYVLGKKTDPMEVLSIMMGELIIQGLSHVYESNLTLD